MAETPSCIAETSDAPEAAETAARRISAVRIFVRTDRFRNHAAERFSVSYWVLDVVALMPRSSG